MLLLVALLYCTGMYYPPPPQCVSRFIRPPPSAPEPGAPYLDHYLHFSRSCGKLTSMAHSHNSTHLYPPHYDERQYTCSVLCKRGDFPRKSLYPLRFHLQQCHPMYTEPRKMPTNGRLLSMAPHPTQSDLRHNRVC